MKVVEQLVDSTNPRDVTVPQLFQIVGEDVCARWEALGDADSKIHWAYGKEAEALISEGYPAMVVYKAIAIKAGKSSETIRQAFYTFKDFDAKTREAHNLAPYSVFNKARRCQNPIEVLEHYVNNQTSVDEIETLFPECDGDSQFENDFTRTGWDRRYYGIYRDIYGLPHPIRSAVEALVKQIDEIIRKANQ